jgi:ribosomal protein S18 acetylase RimI-like enzyme
MIMHTENCVVATPVSFTCTFRVGSRADAPKLEWFGAFTEHRQIIAEAFATQERGEGLVVVGAIHDFPIAQLWVRFAQGRPPRFWAFRVMQPLRGLGVGSKLLRFGENLMSLRHFETCEIGVEKLNMSARRLYESLGYRRSYEQVEEYSYVTPSGATRLGRADQWILEKKLDVADAVSNGRSSRRRKTDAIV